jgi:hypothetical protein
MDGCASAAKATGLSQDIPMGGGGEMWDAQRKIFLKHFEQRRACRVLPRVSYPFFLAFS